MHARDAMRDKDLRQISWVLPGGVLVARERHREFFMHKGLNFPNAAAPDGG